MTERMMKELVIQVLDRTYNWSRPGDKIFIIQTVATYTPHMIFRFDFRTQSKMQPAPQRKLL